MGTITLAQPGLLSLYMDLSCKLTKAIAAKAMSINLGEQKSCLDNRAEKQKKVSFIPSRLIL